MFPGECRVLTKGVDALRSQLDGVEEGSDARCLVKKPRLEFNLQLVAEDEETDALLFLLLRVTFPPLYPLPGHAPEFSVEYAMVTDSKAVLVKREALESLAELDGEYLAAALSAEAAALAPELCVFELTAWVKDHAFAFLKSD
ncbi:hypothetical protein M885DRAFT_502299 [Pelagophyceae sp. CCMP2097]|nr:hypothetical protein M885DRAFT_502299 [Pelagophyceae sp. CCMP2097]